MSNFISMALHQISPSVFPSFLLNHFSVAKCTYRLRKLHPEPLFFFPPNLWCRKQPTFAHSLVLLFSFFPSFVVSYLPTLGNLPWLGDLRKEVREHQQSRARAWRPAPGYEPGQLIQSTSLPLVCLKNLNNISTYFIGLFWNLNFNAVKCFAWR